jgi:hypothetical protein
VFLSLSLSLLDGLLFGEGGVRRVCAQEFVSWERPSSDSPPSLLFSELFWVNFEEEKRK